MPPKPMTKLGLDDTEFQYRPRIVDADIDADTVFADPVLADPYQRSPDFD